MKAKYWKSEFKKCRSCKEKQSVNAFIKPYKGNVHDLRVLTECKFCRKDKSKLKNLNRKLQLINEYSNGKNECQCCGEKLIEFLTLDHIGDSKKELKHHCPGRTLHHAGYPHKDKLRILCMNCNFSYGKYGYCPHVKQGKTFIDRRFVSSSIGFE